MITEDLIRQVEGRQRTSEEAVSICLFRGDGYVASDHYDPLVEFLKSYSGPRDILLFIDAREYPFETLPHNDNLRVFTVLPRAQQPGYLRHLYRYLGSLLGYRWVHHRGSDTPRVHPNIDGLIQIAERYDCPVVTQASSWLRLNTVAGSCSLRGETGLKFLRFVKTQELSTLAPSFYADETLLSRWTVTDPQPTVYFLPEPLVSHPLREHLYSRLLSGPRTIIVNTSGIL